MEIYDVNIVNLKGDFELSIEVKKVEKNILLSIPNPKYQEMLKSHQHLSGITMDGKDEKAELPIHVIIGTNQYPKIKTKTSARIGNQGEPIAELTKFGWIFMSPWTEQDLTSMYLTQTIMNNCAGWMYWALKTSQQGIKQQFVKNSRNS